MATKKSGGSSRNGRDSAGRRLGLKTNNYVTPGSIILRQRGTQIKNGNNTGMGKDHTIYSEIYGTVNFRYNKFRSEKYIDVIPFKKREI